MFKSQKNLLNVSLWLLMVVISLPLMMGQVCVPTQTPTPTPTPGPTPPPTPPPVTTTTLHGPVTSAIVPFASFTPTLVGSTITVQVSGDVTGSRIRLFGTDPGGNTVINFTNPTSNVSVASFTSTSTGVHFVTTTEIGTPSSIYTMTITQQ